MNILLAGVGGQGIVLASKILAQCAMQRGNHARTAETIGMAQRGGSVVSHVRYGTDICSPMIPLGQADVIIGFEPAETVRVLPYLREGGAVVANTTTIKPVTDSLAKTSYDGNAMLAYLREHVRRLHIADGNAITAHCGSAKALNIALIGVAAHHGIIEFTMPELEQVILERIPEHFRELNLRALHATADIGDTI